MHALLGVFKLTCTCSVQGTRAKQAIFLFPLRDQEMSDAFNNIDRSVFPREEIVTLVAFFNVE